MNSSLQLFLSSFGTRDAQRSARSWTPSRVWKAGEGLPSRRKQSPPAVRPEGQHQETHSPMRRRKLVRLAEYAKDAEAYYQASLLALPANRSLERSFERFRREKQRWRS